MIDEETDRLVAEMEALADYRGWSYSYEYPGYFCYHHETLPFRVAFTPDWGEPETVSIQVEDDDGIYEKHSSQPSFSNKGRTGEKLFELVRPTLDKLLALPPPALPLCSPHFSWPSPPPHCALHPPYSDNDRAAREPDPGRGRCAPERPRARARAHGPRAPVGGARHGDGGDRQGPRRCARGHVMSMIFDRFPTRARAEAFRAAVKAEFDLDGQVFDTDAAAQSHDPFPFRLEPPIVHVDRHDDAAAVEERVIRLVAIFGGTFAGT